MPARNGETPANTAALPPQLSSVLGDAAATVCEFTELMPGVPWTTQLMEELSNNINDARCFSVALTHVPGFAKVVARLDLIETKKKKEKTCAVEARVFCYKVLHPPEAPYIAKFQTFPHTPQGMKEAFEFLREAVNYVSRRGFCESCLHLERHTKRIRLQGSDVCGECLLKRALSGV